MILNVEDVDYTYFAGLKNLKRNVGNQSFTRRTTYADCICAFDIETSRIPEIEQSFMYIWQFQVDECFTVIGRTWDEFKYFLTCIDDALQPGLTLPIFVHNLSYEFQFLAGIYKFSEKEVFAVKSRKVLKCTMNNERFEFRCSYLLTNMSLAEFTTKYNVKHKKIDGDEFGYDAVRYPWTELLPKELEYTVHDVLGLVEAVKALMKVDDDNMYTLPYTSTGFVRRNVKKASRPVRKMVQAMSPSYDLYKLLRWAFRGGNTHANRFYSGKVLKNVHSWDRSSSYPDVLCNCKFPVKPFTHADSKDFNLAYLENLIYKREKAVIMDVTLKNVVLRDELWGCPYLPVAKCNPIKKKGLLKDNGRVLKCSECRIALTDIDYKILKGEYCFEVEVNDLYFSSYGKIPKCYVEEIISYYKGKTELKGIENMEVFYMKLKNLLNAIYGMSAQDPVKISLLFRNEEFILDDSKEETEILKESNKRSFMPYAWGVWVTAWARLRLEEGIRMAGDGFVYGDTDSVKYIGDVDWTAYNNDRVADSIKSGAVAVDKFGVTHYMGVYEQEHDMEYFKTLGAKKYCYVESGKLKLTVSGVAKRKGADELLEMAGGDVLKAITEYFEPGTIFTKAGGLEAVYNDNPAVKECEVDLRKIPITRNVCLRPSTYTLSLVPDYADLICLTREDFVKMYKMIG